MTDTENCEKQYITTCTRCDVCDRRYVGECESCDVYKALKGIDYGKCIALAIAYAPCSCVEFEKSDDNYSDDEYPYIEKEDYKDIDAIYAEYNRQRKQQAIQEEIKQDVEIKYYVNV